MDYYELSRQILKQLRGSMTQRDLSSKLGFNFNKIGKVESGENSLKFSDFINICHILNIPIEDHLKKVFYFYEKDIFTSNDFGVHLCEFLSIETIPSDHIKKLFKKSISKLSTLDFAEFLCLLDTRAATLITLLNSFLDISLIDILETKYNQFLASVQMIAEDPDIAFINSALNVYGYTSLPAHSDEVLAIHSNCSVEKIREIFNLNKELSIFNFNGTHYTPSNLNFSFSNVANLSLRKFNKYVLERTANKFEIVPTERPHKEHVHNPGQVSVRTVTLSTEAAKKVAKLIAENHTKISDIVKEDEGNKQTNLHFICMTSVPSP